ncbi:FY-rich, C-terminal [Cynara cardunculus var. scolymus]|uniref:FY-rich, C-terminal n=1 Tax=Cynara cardunculus var. scolymus TaxID=59895 RepID=A0A103XCU6_CYNCS|nr:FY-rich, C-terminal [Cynara cardunculus var. scolymus]
MAFSSQLLTPNANNKQREDDEEEAPPEEQKVLIQSEEDHRHHHQARYVPLDLVYSATSPCSGYSNVMSKKVKARKYPVLEDHNDAVSVDPKPPPSKPPVIHVYSRCRRRKRSGSFHGPSGYDIFLSNLKTASVVELKEEDIEFEGEDGMMGSIGVLGSNKKRKTSQELINLGLDSVHLDAPRLRGSSRKPNRANDTSVGSRQRRSKNDNGENNWQKNGHENEVTEIDNTNKSTTAASRTKRWVRLKFDGVDPEKFVGLQCKANTDDLDVNEMIVLAANLDDCHDIEPGDIIWAKLTGMEDLECLNTLLKLNVILCHLGAGGALWASSMFFILRILCLYHVAVTHAWTYVLHYRSIFVELMYALFTLIEHDEITIQLYQEEASKVPRLLVFVLDTGHAVWPAIVLDESFVSIRRGLSKVSGEKSVLVQFFGTHDFARVKTKQVISFLKGLLSSYHLKCKKLDFIRSLEEAKMYLSRQKLPKSMLQLRNGVGTDSGGDNDEDECSAGSKKRCLSTEIVHRKLKGPKNCPFVVGDLEVLKLGKVVKNLDCFDVEKSIWPLGYTATRKFPSLADPSVCSVYKMEVLRDAGTKTRPVFRVTTDDGDQFDGSDPAACWNKVYDRIRKMHSSSSDNSQAEGASVNFFKSGADMFGFSDPHVLKLIQGTSDSKLKSGHDMPIGYRPVHVKWKDLDKCNVCHMDEEYANNLFLQCDKCRMMVHARCYGELEPVDGVLWLCNLCRTGAPEFSPPCCLCPVTGGAMKPTTDGRWAHLACAMWIPGSLTVSVCRIFCMCSNNACYVAYHPLCARAAGFCAELADVDRLQLVPIDEDEENQCIRLLSFCKKHSPNPLIERIVPDERMGRIPSPSDYTRPVNPSGCARCEPYDYFGRRGRKEPEALAAASLKRAYVENRPYLVGGFCQHESLSKMPSFDNVGDSKLSFGFGKLKNLPLNGHTSIFSMSEKYIYMRRTFRKRLAFGKSGIHGFGIFAKQPHKAGDMVIEYTGEIVRPPIADRREHLIYNSLVGAGTYMFRIDDERVIDATRAGSIAHLINHSCEWEELTYDYRFFSIDEQLACYCGFPSCRGVVNDIDAEVQMAKLYAPRSELKDWEGE